MGIQKNIFYVCPYFKICVTIKRKLRKQNMHSSFFIAIIFEIWVYEEMKIHFLLETLRLSQMPSFHATCLTGIKWKRY